jgi:hypothetical protein
LGAHSAKMSRCYAETLLGDHDQRRANAAQCSSVWRCRVLLSFEALTISTAPDQTIQPKRFSRNGRMSDWFSNRGQIVQVITAITGALVGLLVAVKQQYIPVEYAVVLALAAVWALWFLLQTFERRIAKVVGGDQPLECVERPPDFSTTSSLLPEKFTAKWLFETIKLKKGERWTDLEKKNEIRLLDVQGPVAVIAARAELNQFCAGVNVKRLGSEFALPETSFHDQTSIIVSYTVAKTFVMCFSVRVEHINQHADEVEFVITKIFGA